MKYLKSIIFLFLIKCSFAGIEIFKANPKNTILYYPDSRDNIVYKASSTVVDGKFNFITMNYTTDRSADSALGELISKGGSTVLFIELDKVVSGRNDGPWDLSQTPFLKFNFNKIEESFDLQVGVKTFTSVNNSGWLPLSKYNYSMTPTILVPLIDLRSLLAQIGSRTDELSHVYNLKVSFKNCNLNTFSLKSIELVTPEDVLSSVQVISPEVKRETFSTGGSSTAPGAGHNSFRQASIDTSTQNVAYVAQDSSEVSTDEAVPEPFSILTMGAGIANFIRKRKQKRQK